MRCMTCRNELHDWFDTQGVAPMPEELREHVRDCSDCRAFITRWNGVEVGLQSIRDQSAAPSPDFSVALRARLTREEARRTFRIPFPTLPPLNYGRVALAALALVIVVLAARFSSNVRTFFLPHGTTVAVSHPPRTVDVKPTIDPDLPIANTGTGR